MKKLILTLIIALTATISSSAIEIDTLWFRIAGAGVQELDFTPDDKYVIAWTNAIEFWDVEKGVKEFSIPIDINAVGDYNYNEQYLVFAKDSTPKLLNWKTREVVEGFEKEKENIGRIRTAKSKNEFMVNTYHKVEDYPDDIGNVIYFYDIDSKRKVDSLDLGSTFEKESYKWKRTVHGYDYAGTNDELIYVIIDDANDVLQNIPPMFHEQHYYVNFYNRLTKELVDSVYSFSNTNEHYGGFNRMQVMNDRTKIAWNHNGGEINFYDIIQKRFYDKLVFDIADYVNATDINLSRDDRIITVTNQVVTFLKIYNTKNRTFLHEYTKGSFQYSSFSNNGELLITNIGSWLILLPSHIGTTSVETENANPQTTFSPNPTSSLVNIDLNCSEAMVDYQINDITGATVARSTIANQSGKLQLDFSAYATGVYFLTINCKEPKTYKIIKE